MPKASIEYGLIATPGYFPRASVHGVCAFYEELDLDATVRTTVGMPEKGDRATRITARADMFFAHGSSPNPNLTTASLVSSARRFLLAGQSIDINIASDDRVAVKAA